MMIDNPPAFVDKMTTNKAFNAKKVTPSIKSSLHNQEEITKRQQKYYCELSDEKLDAKHHEQTNQYQISQEDKELKIIAQLLLMSYIDSDKNVTNINNI